MVETAQQETRLQDYRPPGFLVDQVDLAFDLDPAATIVRSRLRMRRNPVGAPKEPRIWMAMASRFCVLPSMVSRLGRTVISLRTAISSSPICPMPSLLEIETRIAPADKHRTFRPLYVPAPASSPSASRKGFGRSPIFRTGRM